MCRNPDTDSKGSTSTNSSHNSTHCNKNESFFVENRQWTDTVYHRSLAALWYFYAVLYPQPQAAEQGPESIQLFRT